MDLLNQRLSNQQISNPQFSKPQDLVFWLGAIQAQDYAMAKWAIGCRLTGSTEEQIEKDFNDSKILRTHVLRPTWHFISPGDIRWMLKLTAPKIKTSASAHHRSLGIDSTILKRSKKIIEKIMVADGPQTRKEIQQCLGESRIKTNETRLGFLLMDAELDGLICSAGRKGKQFAYGLLGNLPASSEIPDRAEAVAKLARRYFTAHGPATVHDFAWWSGVALSEIKTALISCPALVSEHIGGSTYWFSASMKEVKGKAKGIYFLPAFDEYLIGYKNRMELVAPDFTRRIMTVNGIFNPVILQNGLVVGTWKRKEQKAELCIQLGSMSASLKTSEVKIQHAIKKYFRFTGRKGIVIPAL